MDWQFWIDRGGTFTDVVARDPNGKLFTHKLLSENPEHYDNAAIQGIRDVLQLDNDTPIPAEKITEVRMGTTIGTNALLERRGAEVALAITAGLSDALRIGYQNRPDLFALNIQLPQQLYTRVIEIPERLAADGEIIKPLDRDMTLRAFHDAIEAGIHSIAIVLLHAYRYPQHEQAVAELAQEAGFTQISVSHHISPLIKLVSRGETTVVDAYLSPVLQRYVDTVAAALGQTKLWFMQSNGGLAAAEAFRGKDSILSGPAGGIVGAVQTAKQAGFEKIIGFDMGGTSTDVSHCAGHYERSLETHVAGVRLRVPMLQIHTVAAGGGSLCQFDGLRLTVGPESAGANPGPACYRRGGELTVTDCNVLLGRLQPDCFPAVFGEHADQPLDTEIVREKFITLANIISEASETEQDGSSIAAGFLRIAVDNMANAIKKISTQRGYNVSNYTICCFGGAGGQHACQVADALGMHTVFIHPFAGVLSAYGMGLAEVRVLKEQTVNCALEQLTDVQQTLEEMRQEASRELQAQTQSKQHSEVLLYLRYDGTDTSLPVAYDENSSLLADAFTSLHQQRYGFVLHDRRIMIETLSVEMIAGDAEIEAAIEAGEQQALNISICRFYSDGRYHDAPIYVRDQLSNGFELFGPAMITESTGTTIVEVGWRATVDALGNLVLRKDQSEGSQSQADLLSSHQSKLDQANKPITSDPVLLEIFNNLFMSIAEQMGMTLANTAHSVNIKERLDFSCALFDAEGQLVANAPHVPVHLGSMGASVQAIRDLPMQIGDVFLLNSPYTGGTHLPDLTVITPVFCDAEQPSFFVASRAHHADIGGITPGSVPPHSEEIEQEGILIEPLKIVAAGDFLQQVVVDCLSQHRYPVRNLEQNLADLHAQIAANAQGVQGLQQCIEEHGFETVTAYMQHVQDHAEEAVRRVLATLVLPNGDDGRFSYRSDEGLRVAVHLHIDRQQRSAIIDFAGTSPQQESNWNAPRAVAIAAVLYVFRTLVKQPIPLNAGCLKPLEIRIPEGSLLDPQPPAAVVAGNVETSQMITDALYGAIGCIAASQGTMNNLTFGNADYQYYETLCGGAGAGDGFDGASAVHTHMTNSRLTDPEVLEWRYPVRLEQFGIRQDSGGVGRWRGGDGVIRELSFQQSMTVGIVSGHRQAAPCGMAGGADGQVGENLVLRVDGSIEQLGGIASTEVAVGDRLRIVTPGGGGFEKKS